MKIIAVGKKHDTWIKEAIERYEKRLRSPFAVTWQFIPYSAKNGDQARQEESEAIISKLKPHEYVILLDEVGQQLSSPTFSQKLGELHAQSKSIVFVIGGAYGVSLELQNRAHFIWSLSKLVFPHMLVRSLLIEQLYRAQEIENNRPYHHV